MCLYVCVYKHAPQHMCGAQRAASGSWFFPSPCGVPENSGHPVCWQAPCNSSPSLKKQVSCECVFAHLPWPGTCVEVTEQLAEVWFVQGLNSGVRPGKWHPTSSHFSVYGFSNVKHVYWLSSVNNEKSVILSHTGYVFKLRLCFLSALVVRIVFFIGAGCSLEWP